MFEIPNEAFKTTRQVTLETAADCVLRDRCNLYGSPENNFTEVAIGWSVITGQEITTAQVGLMMAWLKIVRANHSPDHMDNYADGAGYFACAAECAEAGRNPASDS
jgi:hypothetical protein